MAVWSSLTLKYSQNFKVQKQVTLLKFFTNGLNGKVTNTVPVRHSHVKLLPIRTSTFHFSKFKNLLHFYLLLGIVPLSLLTFYVNTFIGPAELALIPEGYEPKHWEYLKHPVSRFIAKHFLKSPQEIHERNLHHLFFCHEATEIRKLENKVKSLMRDREDYQAWYFPPSVVKYHRRMMENSDETHRNSGRHGKWIL